MDILEKKKSKINEQSQKLGKNMLGQRWDHDDVHHKKVTYNREKSRQPKVDSRKEERKGRHKLPKSGMKKTMSLQISEY
jgi:hypothetical protein